MASGILRSPLEETSKSSGWRDGLVADRGMVPVPGNYSDVTEVLRSRSTSAISGMSADFFVSGHMVEKGRLRPVRQRFEPFFGRRQKSAF